MKEALVITEFGGLNANQDRTTNDPRSPVWSLNVDPLSPRGSLRGIYGTNATTSPSLGGTWQGHAHVALRRNGTTRHVWHPGGTGDLNYYEYGDTEPTDLSSLTASNVRPSIVGDGEAAFIGLGNGASNKPYWYGYVNAKANMWGDTAVDVAAGWKLEEAEIKPPTVLECTAVSTPTEQGSGDIADGDYYIAYSFLYDGFQESPLYKVATADWTVSGGCQYLAGNGDLHAGNIKSKSERITHVNVYMGYDPTGAAGEPLLPYRLVDVLKWDDSRFNTSSVWSIAVYDPFAGPTYEENADQSQDLGQSIVHYNVGCTHQSRLVVGGCYVPDDTGYDYTNYVMFSRPLQYGVFDWTKDYVRLPEEPVALVSHNNMIYAFSEVNTYIINTNGIAPFLEQTIEGIGCQKEFMPLSTDRGLFHASDSQIYQDLRPIGFPVNNPSDSEFDSVHAINWAAETKTFPFVIYDYNTDCACFFTSTGYVYAYYLPTQSWYLWADSVSAAYAFVDETNKIWLLKRSGLSGGSFLDSSVARLAWRWESGRIAMGEENQEKWVYRYETETTSGTWPSGTSGLLLDDGSTHIDHDSNITGTNRINRWVKIKIYDSAGTGTFHSATIVFRRHRTPRT